jgi:hypothetical protein
MRVRFKQDYFENGKIKYKKGEIAQLDLRLAKFLLKSGVAIVSKDMTENDYAKSSSQRINNPS